MVATQEEREFEGYVFQGTETIFLVIEKTEDPIRLAVTNNKEHKLFGRRMIRFRDTRSHVSAFQDRKDRAGTGTSSALHSLRPVRWSVSGLISSAGAGLL